MLVFLVAYLTITTILGVALCAAFTGEEIPHVTRPSYYAEVTRMNRWGCWLCAVLCSAILPIWSLVSFLRWTCYLGTGEEQNVNTM